MQAVSLSEVQSSFFSKWLKGRKWGNDFYCHAMGRLAASGPPGRMRGRL